MLPVGIAGAAQGREGRTWGERVVVTVCVHEYPCVRVALTSPHEGANPWCLFVSWLHTHATASVEAVHGDRWPRHCAAARGLLERQSPPLAARREGRGAGGGAHTTGVCVCVCVFASSYTHTRGLLLHGRSPMGPGSRAKSHVFMHVCAPLQLSVEAQSLIPSYPSLLRAAPEAARRVSLFCLHNPDSSAWAFR